MPLPLLLGLITSRTPLCSSQRRLTSPGMSLKSRKPPFLFQSGPSVKVKPAPSRSTWASRSTRSYSFSDSASTDIRSPLVRSPAAGSPVVTAEERVLQQDRPAATAAGEQTRAVVPGDGHVLESGFAGILLPQASAVADRCVRAERRVQRADEAILVVATGTETGAVDLGVPTHRRALQHEGGARSGVLDAAAVALCDVAVKRAVDEMNDAVVGDPSALRWMVTVQRVPRLQVAVTDHERAALDHEGAPVSVVDPGAAVRGEV